MHERVVVAYIMVARNGLLEGQCHDSWIVTRDHVAEFLLLDKVDSGYSKLRGKNPIKSARRAAPLQMAQHCDASLNVGHVLLYLTDEESANPAQHTVMIAELIAFSGYRDPPQVLPSATTTITNLGRNESGRRFSALHSQCCKESRGSERCRPSGNGCPSNPAGIRPITSNTIMVVALRGGHELVHSVGGHFNGGLIAEREARRRQIVVDGLGTPMMFSPFSKTPAKYAAIRRRRC
jgi:hypothetical protein